ncbi:MAG: quinolinate synthase NadA [Nitrososphaerales archaeon]
MHESIMSTLEQLKKKIVELKNERNAVILAHNYQIPDVQDLADFVGDSLGLSQAASMIEADVIVFCGVHFMAETAAIINPDKKVLIPDLDAGCSLVNSSPSIEWVREWKKKHPKGVVVSYVNTTASLKAESDYCCTSSNAVKVINAIPQDREILFLPDMFLGYYVEKMTGRRIHIWHGECYVHADIKPEDIMSAMESYNNAELLIHPECSCVSLCIYYVSSGDLPSNKTKILSTEGMVRYAKQSEAKRFLVATEVGILHRLKKECQDKDFIPIRDDALCRYMKMITLDKVYKSLKDMVYEIKVPEAIASRARIAIQRMLDIS